MDPLFSGPHLWVFLVFLIYVAAIIWMVVATARSGYLTSGEKTLWSLVITLVPVAGVIVYLGYLTTPRVKRRRNTATSP